MQYRHNSKQITAIITLETTIRNNISSEINHTAWLQQQQQQQQQHQQQHSTIH